MRGGLALAAIALLGCDAAPANSGLGALLRVRGGQFYPGAAPGDSGGPTVQGIDDPYPTVWSGEVGKPFGGSLSAGATAALLMLDGDSGHWVIAAGVPDITAPDEPTFQATLDFAAQLPVGPRRLTVRAADPLGQVGPARAEPLMLYPLPPPDGALVVTLAWDSETDLDLHVVTPAGVEIWAREPFESSAMAGQPPAPTVGVLDLDSNAACVIDGRRQESVVWRQGPRPGRYLVRVDTASLCAGRYAHWSVTARRDGAVVRQATGYSDATATRASGERGSGVVAFEFDVP